MRGLRRSLPLPPRPRHCQQRRLRPLQARLDPVQGEGLGSAVRRRRSKGREGHHQRLAAGKIVSREELVR